MRIMCGAPLLTMLLVTAGRCHEESDDMVLLQVLPTRLAAVSGPRPEAALAETDTGPHGTRTSVARLAAARQFPEAGDQVLQKLDSMYDGHAHETFYHAFPSAKQEVLAATGSEHASVYGELLPTTVLEMLLKVEATPGKRYYDLGSGTGKTVAIAGLLGLNATGVELERQRFGAACEAVERAKAHGLEKPASGSIRYVHGSFLEVDFSDADVVFTDNVMFPPEMNLGLARAARRMKPGSKIISHGGLPGPGFEDNDSFNGPTNWAKDTRWKIQSVLPGAFDADDAGPVMAFANRSAPQEACQL